MEKYVIDTNCLVMSIPSKSPYHKILLDILKGQFHLCVTTEILCEYEEILTKKMGPIVGSNIVNAILASKYTILVNPMYRFDLIEADKDDNKFVDCAIYSNAKCIVTEDSHYKVLATIPFPHVDVIDIDKFMEILV